MAFHCVPALLLIVLIKMLPDTPRYLASVGRHEEAHEVLKHIRGAKVNEAEFEREYAEVCEAAKHASRSSPVEFAKILVGKSKDPSPHLARRAWLCICLQLMASWSGITGERGGVEKSSNAGLIRFLPRFQPSPHILPYCCRKQDTPS